MHACMQPESMLAAAGQGMLLPPRSLQRQPGPCEVRAPGGRRRCKEAPSHPRRGAERQQSLLSRSLPLPGSLQPAEPALRPAHLLWPPRGLAAASSGRTGLLWPLEDPQVEGKKKKQLGLEGTEVVSFIRAVEAIFLIPLASSEDRTPSISP